jgi:hypothetical protein
MSFRRVSAAVSIAFLVLGAYGACSSGEAASQDAGAGASDSSPADQWAPLSDVASPREGASGLDAGVGNETGPDPDVEAGNADAGEVPDGAMDSTTSPEAAIGGPCPADGGLPNELRCTGLYSDWSTKTVAAEAKYYDPGFKLWSDGAAKRRWIFLPPNSQIDTTDMDDWSFPVGTKIWKEFSLGGQVVAEGKLTGGKIIETRLLWKQSATRWTSTVYRWSDDQSQTYSLVNGEMVPHPLGLPAYEVPTVYVCADCHAGRKDFVLGFDLIGLGVPGAGATGGLTLATLPAGWLTRPPPSMTVSIPEDSTGKAAPALGLLHMNCGVSCHNASVNAKGSVSGLFTKLLASQLYPEAGTAKVSNTDTYTTTVNVRGKLLAGRYMRVMPRNSAQSLLTLLALARDPDAGLFTPMPPIVSHRPDTDPNTGIPLVQAWIDALP